MPKPKLEPLYRCRCCNWLSPRKAMCQTCFDGCVMRSGMPDPSDPALPENDPARYWY